MRVVTREVVIGVGKVSLILPSPLLSPPASEYLVPVRLVNGSDSHSGAVEVRLPGEQIWGSVCDLFFTIQDATVICRQLGFKGMIYPLPLQQCMPPSPPV